MAMMSGSDDNYVKSKLKLLVCGFSGGLVQAGLFNPWDRALYLSIKMDRPFLAPKNFANPFAGLYQTLFQRAVSSGLYFPLEEIFADMLIARSTFSIGGGTESNGNSNKSGGGGAPFNRHYVSFTAGLLAGSLNGLIVNPLAAVKYHYWGTETGTENFLTTARQMLRNGGMRIFLVGTTATVLRDLVFGGTYGLLRHELHALHKADQLGEQQQQQHQLSSSSDNSGSSGSGGSSETREAQPAVFRREKPSFVANIVAACMATVLSSPWNYVRNIHYGTPSGTKPQASTEIWKGLWATARTQGSALEGAIYLQTQLRVGWGTARVGCGMAVSSSIYNMFSDMMA
jgi:hypothetical protein